MSSSETENLDNNSSGKERQEVNDENTSDVPKTIPIAGQVLENWKNIAKTQKQQQNDNLVYNENNEDEVPSMPEKLHVAVSDHDYCVFHKSDVKTTTLKQETGKNTLLKNFAKSPTRFGTDSDLSWSCGSNICSLVGAPPLTNPLTDLLPQVPPMPPVPQTTAFNHRIPPALLPNPDFATLQYFKANNIRYPIRPPSGTRQPREGEPVYCYCRFPYDEVSDMIACDGDNCLIEWFHFECVGVIVAPEGKWFCAECRPKYSEELYPATTNNLHGATSSMNNV